MKCGRKFHNIKICINLLKFIVLSNFCLKYSFGLRCKKKYDIYDGARGYIKTISSVCYCPSDYPILITEEKKCTNYCKNAS